jgi:hypothetical protein
MKSSLTSLIAITLMATGCSFQSSEQESLWSDYEPLIPMTEGPTYQLLEGYNPLWLNQVKEGVELSRAYWGTYGPTRILVLGKEEDQVISAESKKYFLDEYCKWRTASSKHHSHEDCLVHAKENLFGPMERGDSESMLSGVRDTVPQMAELIFINVHNQENDDDTLPGPVQRGIHEYTHVFQISVGRMPTWMMEGGAMFFENWIPQLVNRGDWKLRMRQMMRETKFKLRGLKYTIADMEEIESASEELKEHYHTLAYQSGAWAIAFIIYQSPTQNVAVFRDEFYPLVAELGWEVAVAQYSGMDSKADFYRAFDAFSSLSIDEQMESMGAIK